MLAQARVKEVFHYDPESGIFTWLLGALKGKQAGSNTGQGIAINIDKKRYMARHVAWLYMTGNFPPRGKRVHSKSQNALSVVWSDLTLEFSGKPAIESVIISDNSSAKTKSVIGGQAQKNNTSGNRNVYYHKHSGMWRAAIMINRKQHSLGYFKSKEEAIEAAEHGRMLLSSNAA